MSSRERYWYWFVNKNSGYKFPDSEFMTIEEASKTNERLKRWCGDHFEWTREPENLVSTRHHSGEANG